MIHLGRYRQDIRGLFRIKQHRPEIVRPCHMQIRPCRDALATGLEGSDETGLLEMDALMDQIQLHNGNTEMK